MLEKENGDEENKEEQKKVATGKIVFVIIITASISGLIYLLIKKNRKERNG